MSLTSFLSFATSAPNNMGLVRNELQHVDLPTGEKLTHTLTQMLSPVPEGANHHFFSTLAFVHEISDLLRVPAALTTKTPQSFFLFLFVFLCVCSSRRDSSCSPPRDT